MIKRDSPVLCDQNVGIFCFVSNRRCVTSNKPVIIFVVIFFLEYELFDQFGNLNIDLYRVGNFDFLNGESNFLAEKRISYFWNSRFSNY